MKTAHVAILLALLLAPTAQTADLGDDWVTAGGQWGHERELIHMVKQRDPAGRCTAFHKRLSGTHGAWRASVSPAIGAREAGLWVLGGPGRKAGFLVVLGGTPGVGGFALRSADGKTLWEDRWAPWRAYQPRVIEAVVERGRVRVQMFGWDGKTLVSQGPWVTVPDQSTETAGQLGLYTRDGIARFWGAAIAPKPLAPIVDDAPNKRRLVQGKSPGWTVVGAGNWMWVSGRKQRLRQYAPVERTKAVHRHTSGVHRTWECRLRVDPGAGGAGMYFQCDETAERGLLAWLGGTHGNGSLMLYLLPGGAKWSGRQGHWRYNTDYVLRARTRKGEARVELLEADGKTVIQDSQWVKVGAAADTPGHLALHTWKGTATFWGFSESAQAGPAAPAPDATQLGGGWAAHGGSWAWTNKAHTRLRQSAGAKQAIALNRKIAGSKGTWRCRVRIQPGTTAAGLVFQSSADRSDGFACLLTANGPALETLAGKQLWADPKVKWAHGRDYVLEGRVMTDRVAVRVLGPDGKTVVAECSDVYVPDTNNHRTGHLGLLSRGGPAEFWAWEKRSRASRSLPSPATRRGTTPAR